MKKTALSLFLLAGLAAPLFAQTPDCPKDKCKPGAGCCKAQCAEAKACEGAAKMTAVSQKSSGACCTKQTDKAMTNAAKKKAVVKQSALPVVAAR